MDPIISSFKRFADNRLVNHLLEVATRYNGLELSSMELKEKATRVHQQMLHDELEEKIEALSEPENPILKAEMEQLKDEYIKRFSS